MERYWARYTLPPKLCISSLQETSSKTPYCIASSMWGSRLFHLAPSRGTSFTASLITCALSRAPPSVLHVFLYVSAEKCSLPPSLGPPQPHQRAQTVCNPQLQPCPLSESAKTKPGRTRSPSHLHIALITFSDLNPLCTIIKTAHKNDSEYITHNISHPQTTSHPQPWAIDPHRSLFKTFVTFFRVYNHF